MAVPVKEIEIPETWRDFIDEKNIRKISKQVEKLEKIHEIETLPPREKIYTALEITPLQNVKVVIFGQDPYYDYAKCDGKLTAKATGMSFSIPKGMPLSPSLMNIFKELKHDSKENPEFFKNRKFKIPEHGDLTHWAQQGVLLLNVVPMVFADKQLSGKANPFETVWMPFTLEILDAIRSTNKKCIYVLWGKQAKDLVGDEIRTKKYMLTSAHPSPLSASRGFFGSHPFSKINKLLQEAKKEMIDWHLTPESEKKI